MASVKYSRFTERPNGVHTSAIVDTAYSDIVIIFCALVGTALTGVFTTSVSGKGNNKPLERKCDGPSSYFICLQPVELGDPTSSMSIAEDERSDVGRSLIGKACPPNAREYMSFSDIF